MPLSDWIDEAYGIWPKVTDMIAIYMFILRPRGK